MDGEGVLVGRSTLLDGKAELAVTAHLDQVELAGWDEQETVPADAEHPKCITPSRMFRVRMVLHIEKCSVDEG